MSESLSAMDLFSASTAPRRVNRDSCPVEQTEQKIEQWREAIPDVKIGFVAGCFDLPHLNHAMGLTEHRLRVAQAETKEGSDNKFTYNEIEMAASSLIKLIVTIDTNESVDASKTGSSPGKYNCTRPVLDWATRADSVLGFSFLDMGVSSVDYITTHGINSCSSHGAECVSCNNVFMGAKLDVDHMLVNNVSAGSMKDLDSLRKHDEVSMPNIITFDEAYTQIEDSRIGVVKTSNVITAAIKDYEGNRDG